MVRLYRDAEGRPKGDALVVYTKRPSLLNAVLLLHEAPLRPGGAPLGVEEASKQPSTAAPQGGVSLGAQRAAKVRKLLQEHALSWNEEGAGADPGLKIIALYNLFGPEEGTGPQAEAFSRELQQDLLDECSTYGEVKKVTVYAGSRDGAAMVKFRATRSAEKCVEAMHGRWFDGRQLRAEFWDGVKDLRPQPEAHKAPEEQDAEHLSRLDDFADSLGS